MARKLEYEVEVRTDKAKKRLAAELGAVEGGTAGSGLRGTEAANQDRAAKALKNLGEEAERTGAGMRRLVRGFTGMGIGLAASYAANRLPEGRGRDAVDYAGGVLSGAGAGMMLGGPWGAAAGAAVGGVKTWLDKDGERQAFSRDFEQAERRYQSARDWQRELEGITDLGKTATDAAEKLAAAKAKLEELKEAEGRIVEEIRKVPEEGKLEAGAYDRESLGLNRSRQGQLEAFIKATEKALAEPRRADTNFTGAATDALGRIGGNFAGGGSGLNLLQRTSEEQLKALQEISRNTRGGGSRF